MAQLDASQELEQQGFVAAGISPSEGCALVKADGGHLDPKGSSGTDPPSFGEEISGAVFGRKKQIAGGNPKKKGGGKKKQEQEECQMPLGPGVGRVRPKFNLPFVLSARIRTFRVGLDSFFGAWTIFSVNHK